MLGSILGGAWNIFVISTKEGGLCGFPVAGAAAGEVWSQQGFCMKVSPEVPPPCPPAAAAPPPLSCWCFPKCSRSANEYHYFTVLLHKCE